MKGCMRSRRSLEVRLGRRESRGDEAEASRRRMDSLVELVVGERVRMSSLSVVPLLRELDHSA